MKIIMTLSETQRCLQQISCAYDEPPFVLSNQAIDEIRDWLSDCEPGKTFPIEQVLSLSTADKELLYNEVSCTLDASITHMAFTNEYTHNGSAFPVLVMYVMPPFKTLEVV